MLNNIFDLNTITLNPTLVMGGFTLLCVSGYFLRNYFYPVLPKAMPDLSLDKGTQTVNTLTDAEVQTVNTLINTEVQTVNTLTDAEVQTSLHLLDKLIGDLLLDEAHTICSSRLTSEFLEKYKNNPDYADFFYQRSF